MNLLSNDFWRFKWGLKDDDICTFSSKETETNCQDLQMLGLKLSKYE